MTVTLIDLQQALRSLGLSGRPVCVHASLSSFGRVEGGAETIVQAFLDEGSTLMVPAFSWNYAVPPPPHLRFPRNGWDYENYAGSTAGLGRRYTPATQDIDRDMGAVAAAVVHHPQRVRGDHPICSFAAVGPQAEALIAGQQPGEVYAPLLALADQGGFVLLIGTGLTNLTLVHAAEKAAGRVLFRRWANDTSGRPMAVDTGGCSDGFEQLAPVLAPLRQTERVGQSLWQLFPAQPALAALAAAIRENPSLTRCENPTCDRCRDAVAGGPLLGEGN
jgi:aminoglycoside N3'-acetyltransferase